VVEITLSWTSSRGYHIEVGGGMQNAGLGFKFCILMSLISFWAQKLEVMEIACGDDVKKYYGIRIRSCRKEARVLPVRTIYCEIDLPQ